MSKDTNIQFYNIIETRRDRQENVIEFELIPWKESFDVDLIMKTHQYM